MAEPSREKSRGRPNGKIRHKNQLKTKNRSKYAHSNRQATDVDTPLTELRRKIRSLEKLLAHDTEMAAASLDSRNNPSARSMPSHVRQEKERALAGYKHDLELAMAKKEQTIAQSKMITKYHAVRFYERKKAERILKKARKGLADGDGSEEAVLRAQVDLYYTLYLPLNVKYVSLYPQDRGDDPDNVRNGTSWGIIRDTFVQARDEELREQEIEDKLLTIRDEGWTSRFGQDAFAGPDKAHKKKKHASARSEHAVKKSTAALQKKDWQKKPTRDKRSKPSKPDPTESKVQQSQIDVDMEDDSDGFFEK